MPTSRKKHRINPCRQNVNGATLHKVADEVRNSARKYVKALFLIVLKDRFGFSNDDIGRLLTEYNSYDAAVGRHELKVSDIKDTLKQEYGVELHDTFDYIYDTTNTTKETK